MSLHWELKARIDAHYGEVLAAPGELKQDALIVGFINGLELELRYAAKDEYAFHWQWGEAELRIDTAPLHRGLGTFPNHLHDADGDVRDDPLAQPESEPWHNVRAVIDALLCNPLLETKR